MAAESRGYWTEGGPNGAKSVDEAIALFMADAGSEKGRALADSTFQRYRTVTRRLQEFCHKRKITSLSQLTPENIREHRDTWKTDARGSGNYLTMIKAVLRFCLENGWIEKNVALMVKAPKRSKTQTRKLPYTEDEVTRILARARAIDPELETFILLLRHSGLRISDATFLKREALVEDNLRIVTIKTKSPVTIPIPVGLADRLREVQPKSEPGHLFTTGALKLGTATDVWRRRINPILKELGIFGRTVHSFRHTYATELLSRGVSIHTISRLLTHSSVTITERVYATWIKRGQDRLEEELREAWEKERGDDGLS